MIKDRVFYWALKRQLSRMPLPDHIVLTPENVRIKLDFVDKPVTLSWTFRTPSWWKVLRLLFEEVWDCLKS